MPPAVTALFVTGQPAAFNKLILTVGVVDTVVVPVTGVVVPVPGAVLPVPEVVPGLPPPPPQAVINTASKSAPRIFINCVMALESSSFGIALSRGCPVRDHLRCNEHQHFLFVGAAGFGLEQIAHRRKVAQQRYLRLVLGFRQFENTADHYRAAVLD